MPTCQVILGSVDPQTRVSVTSICVTGICNVPGLQKTHILGASYHHCPSCCVQRKFNIIYFFLSTFSNYFFRGALPAADVADVDPENDKGAGYPSHLKEG